MLAIIGGSGPHDAVQPRRFPSEVVRTPYGEPSGAIVFGEICGQPAMFLPRHGYGHTIPPHMVNYRANIWPLSPPGHRHHFGGLGGRHPRRPGAGRRRPAAPDHRLHLGPPGHLLRRRRHAGDPHRFHRTLRRSPARPHRGGRHRRRRAHQGRRRLRRHPGPRLETAAEIDRLERDGAHVVGMTGMPGSGPRREIGLPYAAINVVANPRGRAGQQRPRHTFRESLEHVLQEAMGRYAGDRAPGGQPGGGPAPGNVGLAGLPAGYRFPGPIQEPKNRFPFSGNPYWPAPPWPACRGAAGWGGCSRCRCKAATSWRAGTTGI